MKILRSLLSQYISIPAEIDAQKLADLVTAHIAEVEDVIDEAEELQHVVVGYIEEILPHPNADALKITLTRVSDDEVIPIVCGGSNIVVGAKVIVAKLGAKVYWHGAETPTIMQKVKIRGEESLGMICASDELRLEAFFPKNNEKEIVILPEDALVGMSIAEYTGKNDVILDIDNKSLTHRPDLWGHRGFARDLGAMFGLDFSDAHFENSGTLSAPKISNEVGPLCLTLGLQRIRTGLPRTSPRWMQEALIKSDIKPINTLVDVTNYVMIELGQPMHAYDARFVRGTLRVKMAEPGQKFTTLDGIERELLDSDLIITDDSGVIGLAGVIGGENSEIMDDTQEILVEAATFDAVSIRRTSTRIGRRTDASKRFEKSLDPQLPQRALARVADLLRQIHELADADFSEVAMIHSDCSQLILDYDIADAEKILGKSIPDAKKTLLALGFEIDDSSENKAWKVTVPSWRSTKDVTRPCDISEELLRCIGYRDIISQPLADIGSPVLLSPERTFERLLHAVSMGFGYDEMMTYSFVGESLMQKVSRDLQDFIPLTNTLSSEHTHLRQDIWVGLLEYIDRSLRYYDEVKVFEIGKVFSRQDQQVQETLRFCAITVISERSGTEESFIGTSTLFEQIMKKSGLVFDLQASQILQASDHPARCTDIIFRKQKLGKLFEIHPNIRKHWKWKKHRVSVLEIDIMPLIAAMNFKRIYTAPAKYPSVIRGISCYLPRGIFAADIEKILIKIASEIVSVKMTDSFVGDHVPDGMRAVSFRIEYRHEDKTLEEQEILQFHIQVEAALQKLGALIRSQ